MFYKLVIVFTLFNCFFKCCVNHSINIAAIFST